MDDIEAESGGPSVAMEVEDDEGTSGKWCRPALPSINTTKDSIVFQQIDLDFYVG